MNSPCLSCTTGGCNLSTVGSSATPQRPPCVRLEAVLPSTCNALSELLTDLSELRSRAALTLAEMERYTCPPVEWPKEARMVLDHCHNRMTIADCARKYQTKQRTAKARMARLSSVVMSAFAGSMKEQKERNENGRGTHETT
jgi:hypothetical protein